MVLPQRNLPLPREVINLAATVCPEFLASRGAAAEAGPPGELALALLAHLTAPHVLGTAGQSGVALLAALVQHIHTDLFNSNDAHCFDAADLASSHEAVLAAWYAALALLGSHGLPPPPRTPSALLSAAAEGTVRLGVTFGGQGKAWLPLLRHLWDVYRPVVQPFLDRMAQALTHAAAPSDVLVSRHLPFGFDFLGWLQGSPPPEQYLASGPVAPPMTAVVQLAHLWLCRNCLGISFQELQRRVTGATGHSLGIVSAVVLAAADSEAAFLQCSATGVTLLFRIGLRAAEVYQVDAVDAASEAGATPMLSVAHTTLSEVRRQLGHVNAQLPPHRRVEIALVNGPTLIVVAGPPSSLLY
eukprot:EG_transcript_16930